MKYHSIITVLFVLILSSCTERASKPRPFLSEKKMIRLLTELHLTEAALQQMQSQSYNFDSVRLYTNAMYNELFEKYGLNKESFEANLYYRTYHSRDLERIYTAVNDILVQKEEQNRQKLLELQEKKTEESNVNNL